MLKSFLLFLAFIISCSLTLCSVPYFLYYWFYILVVVLACNFLIFCLFLSVKCWILNQGCFFKSLKYSVSCYSKTELLVPCSYTQLKGRCHSPSRVMPLALDSSKWREIPKNPLSSVLLCEVRQEGRCVSRYLSYLIALTKMIFFCK